jgi:Beta-propeller repeat
MKAAFLAAAVLAIAGVAFYFSTTVHAAKASGPGSAERKPAAHKTLTSKSLSLPLFFEPNQGQTAPQVKFLARGAGYGLFLTADEAVLQLHPSAVSSQPSALSSQGASSSVIRMRLDGANSSARISGASPLPGKSSYFIGNDPSKWHRDIPQFARVQYEAVYPGVNLVYYGDQGQLEYDFRVAPAADPNQIALSFNGASARIVSGDLLLATDRGDVRFQAPRIYQQDGKIQKPIAGSFRQLADNKIGFTIGDYDHSRELVIDPVLSYSTYLGGSKTEAQVKIAVDAGQLIYVAGATNSPDFPVTDGSSLNPAPGAQNIFISKINPTLAGTAQLVYSIYLGGSGIDSLSGIAVDAAFSIYVAGSTTSSDFPTTSNAFQQKPQTGSHGFLSKLTIPGTAYGLAYSTYLAGNGVDHVTGLAIDTSQQNAYVTGDTTSTNPASDGFPANPNAFQPCPFGPVQSGGTCPVASGPPQFFASKINTGGSGPQSMLYSTYFGGGNPAGATAIGGGIAVDPSPNSAPNMYITGTTNMLPTVGGNGEAKFPLFNAQQSCLNEASNHGTCTGAHGTTNTDAFVAKINPNQAGSSPVYSTYVGGGGVDAALAIAVDTSGMAYITGSTNSGDWVCTNSCPSSFQGAYGGGATDAFIVKIGNLTGSIYPLNYFTYLGGNGDDVGNDIKVDSTQGAHVVGSTTSTNFPTTINTLQSVYGFGGDAFVASIGTTLSGVGNGDLSTYLGGNQLDQGTGIDLDIFGATYVAGNTLSPNFPTKNPYQLQLNGGSQDAFVTEIGAASTLVLSNSGTGPAPNPVAAGTQVAFTFDILNQGPDNASNVTFLAIVPIGGAVASSATAKVTLGSGSCGPVNGNIIQCLIPTLTACIEPLCTSPLAAVEVDVTPSITANNKTISVSGSVSANGGGTQGTSSQTAKIVDFSITPTSPATLTVNAGDPASASTFQLSFCPTDTILGYNATITPSQTTSPAMVTATTPIFNPTPVTLSGSACQITALSIATVARPVVTGTLLRRGSFYAAWLPIGGLSLVGLGLGAGRKRRRWLAAAVLCLIAGAILLQSGCGSSSSSVSTGGGTLAGTYTITITGSAATGASHNATVTLTVR